MKFALIAVLSLLFLPFATHAQSLGQFSGANGGPPSLTLLLSPESPQPYGQLTITPQSTILNLSDAHLSITVNGTNVPLSAGGSATVTLPGPGVKTTIVATAAIEGQSYQASATILPGTVALVEEPIASAPALYLGKPLVPEGGSVRIVAMPDFETSPGLSIAPSALSYSWSV
ncbi:MAG: hypothetical protein ACREGR_04620, partial [Minisyncoccia bacterium]